MNIIKRYPKSLLKEGNTLKNHTFIFSTLILIVANFFLRFLGFVYKILLSRYLGSEGIGLFHLSFHALLIAITITASGIPVAVSKIIAQKKSLKDYYGCYRTLKISVILGLTLSMVISIFVYYNISYIVNNIIKNNQLYLSVIALIPAIPLITLASILRSYYYGIKNVRPAATSQIIEQVLRITFVIGMLYIFSPLNLIYSVIIATVGITVGEFAGLFHLVISFFSKNNGINKMLTHSHGNNLNKDLALLKKIVCISIPITIARLVSVLIQSANMFLVPQRLQVAGYSSDQSVAAFGEVVGMTFPLLFLPFIVTSALAVNIIPNISEEIAQDNWFKIEMKSILALRITLLVSIPIGFLFFFYSKPICMFLYDNLTVGLYLKYLSFTSIFLSLHHILSGILHGMGKQVRTTVNYLIGMSIHLLCIYFLVANPNIGINGFIIGFVLSSFLILTLNYFTLKSYINIEISVINHIVKPILASITMILTIKSCYLYVLNNIFPTKFNIVISVFLGGIIYLLAIFISGSIKTSTINYVLGRKK